MKSLGDRMKRYESVSKQLLTPGVPVIIRVDGKAFHTFTRSFDKPFSDVLMDAMDVAAARLARVIQGCKAWYVQSDEVTFLLTDYERVETQGWFEYNHSKLVSLSASYMSVYFNQRLDSIVPDSMRGPAVFDSRAFNVPKEDVVNCFLWRMRDWHRNSVQMFARSVFSHKELRNKKLEDIHDMLHKKGKNWATDLTPREKNGKLIVKTLNGWTWIDEFRPHYDEVSQLFREVL